MTYGSKAKQSNARALIAITELMQCQLLSKATIEYLEQVRDMLLAEIQKDTEEVSATA